MRNKLNARTVSYLATRNRFGALVAGLVAAAATMVVLAQPALASGPAFVVMNTSESLPDGVWFRNSPHTADTNRETGFGVYKNEYVQAVCYQWGDAVGAYGNTVWYLSNNLTRPTINGHANSGYLNTHYVNDGMTANHVYPGIPQCGSGSSGGGTVTSPPPPPSVTPCVFDTRWAHTKLTFNYGGGQAYYGNAWQGAKNWTNLNLPITITAAAKGTTADVTFTDVNYPNVSWAAQAQVPTSWTTTVVDQDAPYTVLPAYFHNPTHVSIYVNKAKMPPLTDFQRTLVMTHELGHALGLGHTDRCGVTSSSIMHTGPGVLSATFNTPQSYDRINLEQLYGLPTG
jgi:predicted Zn-dependent protease